ncbi:MAG: hypothetical protein IT482_12345 [Gammaproteobacteria bacterium]|nr:hypothetical protein [Gammaproteobacteria bacterium]
MSIEVHGRWQRGAEILTTDLPAGLARVLSIEGLAVDAERDPIQALGQFLPGFDGMRALQVARMLAQGDGPMLLSPASTAPASPAP